MKHLDLFSGIGGFALAAKWCWGDEYENVGHSEIEEFLVKYIINIFQKVGAWVILQKSNGEKVKRNLLPEDSLVSPTVSQVKGRRVKMRGIYGVSVSEPYAQYDPDTHSLRTFQGCLPLNREDSSTEFLQTWQKSGMMRNGKLYQLVLSEHHIHGKECGLWPTPQASDSREMISTFGKTMRNKEVISELGIKEGWINPELSEWLMGYLINWTDLQV